MDAHAIREKRMERGLTIQEVSKRIGAPYSAVHRWEMGKNKPSAKYKKALEDLLAGTESLDGTEDNHLRQRIADLEELVSSQKDTIALQKEALNIAKSTLVDISNRNK